MSEKLPQPTETLIRRLRRVAKWIEAQDAENVAHPEAMRARANTCWQCAARLEQLDAALTEVACN